MWNLLATLSLIVAATTSSPALPGPTLAVEDTMTTSVPEVLVRAPRVTLGEILDRVARGEARRDSLLVDQTFTAVFRVVRHGKDGREVLMQENVMRVYKKRPDHVRGITLRRWTEKADKDANMNIRFRANMSEELVNFAFRPEYRHNFRFKIVGRELLGNHVIYRIAFEPRVPLDPSDPSGLVWVDTNDFVIVRQELNFPRSPAALFIKGVDRVVIERQNVEGHWVLRRALGRMTTTLPIPKMGRIFDFSMTMDQYAINTGLSDSLFTAAPNRSGQEGEE